MFFERLRIGYPLHWTLKPKKFIKGSKENFTGRVNLPEMILEDLIDNNVRLPYIFEISHGENLYKTNCGCLEFTALEDEIIIPEWMHQQLDITDEEVTVRYVQLPLGHYVKLLPHDAAFLDVENPKGELEKNLRDYPVLSCGDEILCRFEEVGNVRFTVSEIKPAGSGIYIVDTDLSVEFQTPLGYEEKLERERTIQKYVTVECNDDEPRRLKMMKFGVCFSFKEVGQNK